MRRNISGYRDTAPYFEIFARGQRKGWDVFGDQAEEYNIDWDTYANHSQSENRLIVPAEAVLEIREPECHLKSEMEKKIKRR